MLLTSFFLTFSDLSESNNGQHKRNVIEALRSLDATTKTSGQNPEVPGDVLFEFDITPEVVSQTTPTTPLTTQSNAGLGVATTVRHMQSGEDFISHPSISISICSSSDLT